MSQAVLTTFVIYYFIGETDSAMLSTYKTNTAAKQ